MGKAEKYGPELVEEPHGGISMRVGEYKSRSKPGDRFLRDPRFSDPKARIDDMDANGIDVMGVTISPLFYLYWAEPRIGIEFSKFQNDSLANFCRPYPDRLFHIPTLPLQDIDASIKEMDRAINDLGGRGINIGTDDLAGRTLDEQALWPLYEQVQKYDKPMFIHPHPQTMHDATAEDRYNLSWIAGYVHQETVAVSHLIFGGVLDEFPDLKICIPHGGGSVPYQWGRLEYAAKTMPDVKCKKPLREYLKNFYFDIIVHDLKAREFLVDFMGVDNLLVGSNYMGWDAVNSFEFAEQLNLSEEDKAKITGGTAIKLFKLDQTAAK